MAFLRVIEPENLFLKEIQEWNLLTESRISEGKAEVFYFHDQAVKLHMASQQ